MTRNNKASAIVLCYWNEKNLNLFSTINWRASLVPAAAVIPAPIAYINVVAVKKLVVEFLEFGFNPGVLFIQTLCIVFTKPPS